MNTQDQPHVEKMNKNSRKKGNWKKQRSRQAGILKSMVVVSGVFAILLFAVVLHRLDAACKSKRRGHSLYGKSGHRREGEPELL